MAKLLEVKIMTVKELIEDIRTGKIKTDTTTQRKFIYNGDYSGIKKVNTESGTITKAGYVIYNILNKGIILPAITLWKNTETGELNLQDGKQRSLSLLNFVLNSNVVTYVRGKCYANFNALDQADQDKLLNYQIAVQINEGNNAEEQENFYEVNSNSINLTDYENLRSVLYGPYLYSFEDYIDGLVLDNITKVGRGDQAYKFLLALYDLNDSKQAGTADTSRRRLRERIDLVRGNLFDPNYKDFAKMLDFFNSLMQIKFNGNKGLSEDVAIAISRFVIRNYPARLQDVLDLYRRSARVRNDIITWASDFNNNNLQTHKCFIEAYLMMV